MSVRILDSLSAHARLKRMAFEIIERNFDLQTLIFWGIDVRGLALAEVLARHLQTISDKAVYVFPFQRGSKPNASLPDFDPQTTAFIVTDDVLYTGRTLLEAVSVLYPIAPLQIQVAVLIDRGHHHLPIQAQYVGLELATTLQEYITVEVEGERIEAFLQ
jgi:pyrimidine operon attenuation protein/uracil phosphoribosyltransferase